MPNLSVLSIDDKPLTIKDATAREAISQLQNTKANHTEIATLEETKADKTEVSVERRRIDNIVNELNGEYGSYTLWTGKTYGFGETITLADAYTNYDYLDFYVRAYSQSQGNVAIRSFSTNYSSYVIRLNNLVDTATTIANRLGLTAEEMKVGVSGNVVSIDDHVQWTWSGLQGEIPSWRTITSENTASNVARIIKIVGRKVTANTEVTDLRVGADGETYASAGVAVRSNDTLIKGKLDYAISGGYYNEEEEARDPMQLSSDVELADESVTVPKLASDVIDLINSGSGGGGGSVTVDSELSTASENPVQNRVITNALNEKGTYSKPSGGIPKADLAQAVQTSLGKADTALQAVPSEYVTETELNSAIQSIGTVFTIKGDVATVNDLPATGNSVGDVYYVQAVSAGYIWLETTAHPNGYWEELGEPIDLTGYIQKPSGASAGQFLVYNGSQWVAQTLSTWSGGNY